METKNQKVNLSGGEINLISLGVKEDFELFEYHFKSNHNVLISYKGPFDKLAIGNMSEYIREMMDFNEIGGKKIFKIYMEIAQNIGYYSAEKNKYCKVPEEAGVGTLSLFETDNEFFIVAGNIIFDKDIVKLKNKCEIISSLDLDGLRELRRKQLDLPDSSKGGANVGLIHVAILSENLIVYDFTKLNDSFSFFTISIKVNKK